MRLKKITTGTYEAIKRLKIRFDLFPDPILFCRNITRFITNKTRLPPQIKRIIYGYLSLPLMTPAPIAKRKSKAQRYVIILKSTICSFFIYSGDVLFTLLDWKAKTILPANSSLLKSNHFSFASTFSRSASHITRTFCGQSLTSSRTIKGKLG
jgi:hypothetical protein